ncbi:hypothetical protein [Brasilonema sp. UFV-L1]|uniref:hypothetical protein n=1 Tax=Brasilonema sp. UFV-L1 TaxID=2234130 RepID=UPI00145D67C3|nr:hypothetical protein [Brasilonema sp. UFV-L1]
MPLAPTVGHHQTSVPSVKKAVISNDSIDKCGAVGISFRQFLMGSYCAQTRSPKLSATGVETSDEQLLPDHGTVLPYTVVY